MTLPSRYNGEGVDKEVFLRTLDTGPPSLLYMDIVKWLASQLFYLRNLENEITVVSDHASLEEKVNMFGIDLSSLLKELHCPIRRLTTGQMEDRISNTQAKIDALIFLCSELQATKIIVHKKSQKQQASMQIELIESKTARELKEMLISLNFGKPPDTITSQQLFGEIEKKIKLLSNPMTPKEFVGELLFSGYLTEKQWFQIEDLYKELIQEYKTRRRLLMTRLDVTIQSFFWADRLKGKEKDITAIYQKKKGELSEDPTVQISNILSASIDLAAIEKTSSGSVRKNTKSSVNKVIIGAVPDRGGRPEEQRPPPPEVPSWQKSAPPSGRGGYKPADNQRQSEQPRQDRQQWQDNQNRQQRRDGPPRQDRYVDQGSAQPRERGSYHNRGAIRQPPPHVAGPLYNANEPSYVDARRDYNAMYAPPGNFVPQMLNQCPQQFGFGGYGPAGDNYSQYGNSQSAPSGGPRQRGGGRPYRGNTRGRGRY